MGFLLLLMILMPLFGAGAIAVIGSRNREIVRLVALATTLVVLGLAAIVVLGFQPRAPHSVRGIVEPRMVLDWNWFTFGETTAATAASGNLQFYLGMDGISLWLVALTALLMVSAVLVSWEAIKEGAAGYYALLLLLESGMIGVFCAFDLILFYIFFEFTLIPLFFLIGIWGGPQRSYAARKFFIYTLAGSLVLLVGLLAIPYMVSQQTGQPVTFSIPKLASAISAEMNIAEGAAPVANVADPAAAEAERLATKEFWYRAQFWIFLALFAGFAIKVPLFPFHTWLPLAHVEAPTAGSVLLAGVLLKLGSYGFLRICLPLLPYATWNLGVPLIAILSIIGILYGALCALAQEDIKRLVAYSSVSHLGFCMLGMFALNEEGLAGSTLQMVNHGLSTGGLFLLVGMLYERYHTRQLAEMGGLAAKLPLFAVMLVFMSLSSVGLPGLNGFVGEVLSLIGMFKVHKLYAILGTVGIVLGAWYLFNMLQRVLFGPLKEPEHGHEPIRDLKGREIAALVPIAVLCVVIGIFPGTFLGVINPDVRAVASIYDNPNRLLPPGTVVTAEEPVVAENR